MRLVSRRTTYIANITLVCNIFKFTDKNNPGAKLQIVGGTMVVSSITSHRVQTEFESISQLGPFRVQSSLCLCGFPLDTLASSYSPKAYTLGYLVTNYDCVWEWLSFFLC